MPFLILLIIITLSASPLKNLTDPRGLYIWNVGQGQWITLVTQDSCSHFDMGGEFFPFQRLQQLCGSSLNKIYLSHWDWDHFGGLRKLPFYLKKDSLCIAQYPLGKSSAGKMKLLNKFKACTLKKSSALTKWSPPQETKNSNERSHVIQLGHFLFPGDSSHKNHTLWTQGLPRQQIRILILSHHGSLTGTSPELLESLPNLHTTIASARAKRYGHPHFKVQAMVKNRGLALLRTEDWGNLRFPLQSVFLKSY